MYNIILPTYNERDNIGTMILMIQDVMNTTLQPYKIIVIDDSSPDGTYDVVKSMNSANVLLFKRERKLGLGSAYKAALEYCEYPFVIVLDSDLQHDPKSIQDMIKMVKPTTDIVSSTRYSNQGGVYGWSLRRKITSLCANNIARFVLNIEYSDVTGSFRLYRTNVFRQLIKSCTSNGFSFQMELMYLASKLDFTVSECPIVFHDRKRGLSKLSGLEVLKFLSSVVRLYFSI